MWRAQRRANAASARPPRTPRAYGFTASNNFSSFLRPLVSTVAHLRERPSSTRRADSRVDGAKCATEVPRRCPPSSDDAAEPRLRRVAVRRGVGPGAEVGREVGGRHVYFVERGARERADELQSLLMQRSLVSSS